MREYPIYLDCAAAMPPDAEVLEYCAAVQKEFFANQEAIHLLAYRTRQEIVSAEKRLALLLTGDENSPVVWGNSATELFHWLAGAPFFQSVVTSVLEHPAVTANFRKLPGFTEWQADENGMIIPQEVDKAPDAAVFCQVQSELGAVQDLDALFERLPGACRIVDAVQAAGKLELYPGADVWIISGAKLGAPGGAAALLDAKGRFTEKLLTYAKKYRHENYAAGRIPAAAALTLVYAAERCMARRESEYERIVSLRRMVTEACAGWHAFPTVPDGAEVSPYILNILLEHQQSAIVVRALSERGIYTASGSACSAESGEPSAALLALKRSRDEAYRALRISFGAATTAEDVKIFLFELENVLKNY